jgi:hypothetical protein
MNQDQSEIARFRAQIEVEHAAMVWALNGLSEGSARHAFIDRRMRHMDISYQGLSKIVGEEQATATLCEVWEKTPKQAH